MSDLIVVFGVKLDQTEGEMAKAVIEMAEAGYSDNPSKMIRKMGELGYNEGLILISKVLTQRGYSDIPALAIDCIS